MVERQSAVSEGLGVVTRQSGESGPLLNPRPCKTSRNYEVTQVSAIIAKAFADWIMDGEATDRQIADLLPAANAAVAALRAKDIRPMKLTYTKAKPIVYEDNLD